jgi:hypothetical protein
VVLCSEAAMRATPSVSLPSTTPPPLPPTSRAARDRVRRLRHVWNSVNNNAEQRAPDMRTPPNTTNRPQLVAIRRIAPGSELPTMWTAIRKAITPRNEHRGIVGQESDDVERVSQVLEMTDGISAVYKLYFLVSYSSTRLTCYLYTIFRS